LFEACSPNSGFGSAQKSLGTAAPAMLAYAVVKLFLSMGVEITKSNRLGKNPI